MPILPVQAAGALLVAAPLAEAALTSVSATFADLLSAATSKDADPRGTVSTAAAGVPLGLEGLTGNQTGSPVGSLRAQTESLLRQFHELLQSLLVKNEIDPGNGFRLQADENGQIHVTGAHPESFRIDNLFASNPELSSLFGRISAGANLLQAIEAAAAFQQEQANEQLPRLFPVRQTPPHNFSLIFDRERATVASD